MGKPVIAIDIDEVLFPFVPTLTEYHNQKYLSAKQASDFVSYDFAEIMGIATQDATSRIVDFLQLDNRHIDPVPQALEVIGNLRKHYKLVIVTSRDGIVERRTKEWIEHHFAGVFDDIVLAGNHHQGGNRPKSEVCKEVGAMLLIDDSLLYVQECIEQGIDCILFGDYPWNQMQSLPNRVRRARNWLEVEDMLIQ